MVGWDGMGCITYMAIFKRKTSFLVEAQTETVG
jgi:hypothetical protein